jgi:ribosomal protein L7/L12
MSTCPKCGKSNPAGTPLCGKCGETLPQETSRNESVGLPGQPPNGPDDEVLTLIRSGNKIAAIKAYRERTGLGLKEAKDAVEALAAQPAREPNLANLSANGPDDEVLTLIRSGKKIAAIKAYREQTGVGLKDAKDAVEALAAEHGIAPRPSGCGVGVLLAILIAGGLAAWIC